VGVVAACVAAALAVEGTSRILFSHSLWATLLPSPLFDRIELVGPAADGNTVARNVFRPATPRAIRNNGATNRVER